MNALALETAVLSADGNELVILDQTLLPNEIRYLHLTKKEEIWEAINKLRVRGAPAIGVAAAYGLYVVARTFDCHDSASFIASLKNAAAYLNSSRPTAVNLSWALRRMVRKAEENASCAVPELLDVLRKEADLIREEDIAISRSIGEYGFSLLHHGDGILTHCNAGWLAFVDYGSALSPVYAAFDAGIDVHVWVDETRPRNQGAALTAWELGRHGVPHDLVVDNAGGHLMQHGMVDMVITGSIPGAIKLWSD